MIEAGILDDYLPVANRAAKPVNGSVVVVAANGATRVRMELPELSKLLLAATESS